MAARINREWRLAAHPRGEAKPSDFVLHEMPLPEPGEGEYLVRLRYLTVTPALRLRASTWHPFTTHLEPGEVVGGVGVGEVVASRHPDIHVGEAVRGAFGWQEYALVDQNSVPLFGRVPPGVSLSHAISVLGSSGLTAYFGLLAVGQPEPGETVVVSSAAGAVGSLVGQLAKIHGCRVVGLAGTAAKCAWLTTELGFDAAINYRREDVGARLTSTCPAGVDIYFDNVGGELLDIALIHLARHARVVLCGATATYNVDSLPPGPRNLMQLIAKEARMEGFIFPSYAARFPEAEQQLGAWLGEGKLRATETILDGLEQAPTAFLQLFSGENMGQLLVQVSSDAVEEKTAG